MASRSAKQTRYAPAPMVSSTPKPKPIVNAIKNAVTSRAATQKPMMGAMRTAISADTDRNGNRLGPRPTVGPADPATRRAALDKALQPGPPVKSSPKPKPAVAPPDASGLGGRIRSRAIDERVRKMS
jgi:hypothetical protein